MKTKVVLLLKARLKTKNITFFPIHTHPFFPNDHLTFSSLFPHMEFLFSSLYLSKNLHFKKRHTLCCYNTPYITHKRFEIPGTCTEYPQFTNAHGWLFFNQAESCFICIKYRKQCFLCQIVSPKVIKMHYDN